MNDCITTTKQNTTKPCAYFSGYTVHVHGCKQSIHDTKHRYVNQLLGLKKLLQVILTSEIKFAVNEVHGVKSNPYFTKIWFVPVSW